MDRENLTRNKTARKQGKISKYDNVDILYQKMVFKSS